MSAASLSALEGHTVTRARVQIPAWGAWWADVDLAEAAALSGSVALTIGGYECHGAIVSGGAFNGRAAYRIVAGAGGWGRTTPPKAYHDDAGVKASTVLADAAAFSGETLAGAPATRLGPHYARASAMASQVLHSIASRGWYVDFAGVTQIGARASTTYAGTAPRTRVEPAARVIEIATDDLRGLVPGVQVDGSAPAVDVEWVLDAKRLTARVYAGSRTTRRLDAIARILDALDPWRRYRACFEYRVATRDGWRLNLQAVRASDGVPDLARVPVRPGLAGTRATVKLGELVLVAFAGGDPSRPNVISHDAPDAPGWLPDLIELGEATDFAALAGKVGTEIQRIRTWADAHTHPTGVGPSGPPAAPTTAHQSTACTKVKVQ